MSCPFHSFISMVLKIEGRWPYSFCFVGCCFQDLFNITRRILVQVSSDSFSIRLVRVQVVHPYSSIDTTAPWKKLRFILSDESDFHLISNLTTAVHALLVALSTNFREPLGLHVNAHKTEYMCFNQTGDISTLNGTYLKLIDKFTYQGSSVSSTEKDIDTRITKT